jgi:hypothetical protein
MSSYFGERAGVLLVSGQYLCGSVYLTDCPHLLMLLLQMLRGVPSHSAPGDSDWIGCRASSRRLSMACQMGRSGILTEWGRRHRADRFALRVGCGKRQLGANA